MRESRCYAEIVLFSLRYVLAAGRLKMNDLKMTECSVERYMYSL